MVRRTTRSKWFALVLAQILLDPPPHLGQPGHHFCIRGMAQLPSNNS
jgi:hypothetical protein